MWDKIRKNYKLGVAFILGIIVSGLGVYAVTILSSSDVFYDNSKSGGNSTNVQGAIEELYQKTKDYKPCSSAVWEANNKYFVEGYTYNASSCVTGDEATCLRTDCYISSEKTCPVGTIIDYVVSGNSNKVRFHVLHDDGETMTMQSQRNTLSNIAWYNSAKDNNKGPLTVLPELENATTNWKNVNNQTYTMGTTTFKDNAFTGCPTYNSCTTNSYTLGTRTAKTRMITAQEVVSLGCTNTNKSCPIWMYNYLYESTNYGGTVNDSNAGLAYWTMSASSPSSGQAWFVSDYGRITYNYTTDLRFGSRAVVVVNK